MANREGTGCFAPNDRRAAGHPGDCPSDEETPASINTRKLFHVQQELLRQEFPQEQLRGVQQQQSQCRDKSWQRLIWQQRRLQQARQIDLLREQMGMSKSRDRGKMGGMSNLGNASNVGSFHSTAMASDRPFILPMKQIPKHDGSVSFPLRGQSKRRNDLTRRSTGSIQTSSQPFDHGMGNHGNSSNPFSTGSQRYYSTAPPSKIPPPNSSRFLSHRWAEGEASSFALPNNNLASKRRRLHFNGDSPLNEKLMLEMLTDTVMSPKTTNTIHAQSVPAASTELGTSDRTTHDGGRLSPFSSYAKPRFLTSLSQTQVKGNGTIGNTPKMFTDLFLGTLNNGSISGGLDTSGLDVSAMSPPPLVKTTDSNSKNSSEEPIAHLAEKASLKRGGGLDDVPRPLQAKLIDWLPLPPRKSQPRKRLPEKKKSSCAKGQKKNKDATSDSSGPNPNHVITPSSATISALSAEIKLSMKSSSTQESCAASDARSGDNDSDDGKAFSVPNFASVMEASQQSQQSIHDWDRRFGLRRAHSKTMRESCRSRKKVLEFLKGEGSNLLLFRKSLSPRATPGLRESSSNTAACSPHSEEEKEGLVGEDDDQDTFLYLARPDSKELDDAIQSNQKSCQQEQQESSSSLAHSASFAWKVGDIESKCPSKDIPEDQADCQSECSLSVDKQSNKDGKEAESGREEQLEQLFRRASLDCVNDCTHRVHRFSLKFSQSGFALPGESITVMPSPPQEGDRKQFHARGA